MAVRFRSICFFILVVFIVVSISEGRPLKINEEEVKGIFRTLKESGPSPGPSHKVKKVQNMMWTKNSGPSQGLEKVQEIGVVKHSGPSPGQGHKALSSAPNRS